MEAIKAMIHDQDLPMHLWAEVARTTIYVQNISPHRVHGNKNWKKCYQERNQRLAILECLVSLYIYMFPRKRDQSWNRQEERGYLLAIVNPQKHIGSTFWVLGRLRLTEMLLTMRIQLSTYRGQNVQNRFMMRSLKRLG